jgi:hypothetical protein
LELAPLERSLEAMLRSVTARHIDLSITYMASRKTDPLQILPYDVWVLCMRFYVRDQPEGALPLLAVSQAWQADLLDIPEIWATIYFDGALDEERRAEVFFFLSKHEPIELILDRNSGGLRTPIKHGDRIRSLVFRTKYEKRYLSYDLMWLSYELSTRTYSNLLHIYVDPPCEEEILIPFRLIEACPALVGIHGVYIKQETLPYLPPSVKILGIIGDETLYNDIYDQVEILHVRWLPSKSNQPGFFDNFKRASMRLKSFALHPNTERSATWSNRLYRQELDPLVNVNNYLLPIQVVTSAAHSNLITLSVTIPWYAISELASCVTICAVLRDLELIFDYSMKQASWEPQSLMLGNIKNVRKLSLGHTLLGSSWMSSSQRNARRSTIGHNIHSIIQVFSKRKALRHVEELRIALPQEIRWELRDMPGLSFIPTSRELDLSYISSIQSCLLRLLFTAKRLNALHLVGGPLLEEAPNYKTVSLIQLHTLVVQFERDLNYIEAPNIVSLKCSEHWDQWPGIPMVPSICPDNLLSLSIGSDLLYRWGKSRRSKNAADEPFSRLLILRLASKPHDYLLFYQLKFSNLVSISFEEPEFRVDGESKPTGVTHHMNQFMVEMLLSRDTCPHLNTMKSTRYPNWALTIALLHQRNSLKGGTPITSFYLPGYPQVDILEMLVNALAGIDGGPGVRFAAARKDQIIHRRCRYRSL